MMRIGFSPPFRRARMIFVTIGCHISMVAQPVEHPHRHLLVDRVIFCQQNVQRVPPRKIDIRGWTLDIQTFRN